MPLALVIWAGPVILPPPDATPNVTATPATGFAKGSCTSTAGAIATGVPTAALWLLPALMVIVEAALAFTLTVAVWVTARPVTVAETVFDSATVELKLPVATPLALVVPTGWVSVFPVPVAASTTVAPAIGLPNGSLAVTVINDWLLPLDAAIGEVAVTVDCAADTAVHVRGDRLRSGDGRAQGARDLAVRRRRPHRLRQGVPRPRRRQTDRRAAHGVPVGVAHGDRDGGRARPARCRDRDGRGTHERLRRAGPTRRPGGRERHGAAGKRAGRGRQGVGSGRRAQGPTPHRCDAAPVGGLAPEGDAPPARRHRKRHRHAGHGVGELIAHDHRRRRRDRRPHGGALVVAGVPGDLRGGPGGAGRGERDGTAGQGPGRGRQGVGPGRRAQGPTPHRGDAAPVGGLAPEGGAPSARGDGKAHRHPRHRIRELVAHDYRRWRRHRRPDGPRLTAAGTDRYLRRPRRGTQGPAADRGDATRVRSLGGARDTAPTRCYGERHHHAGPGIAKRVLHYYRW